jgi:hypothetical protein
MWIKTSTTALSFYELHKWYILIMLYYLKFIRKNIFIRVYPMLSITFMLHYTLFKLNWQNSNDEIKLIFKNNWAYNLLNDNNNNNNRSILVELGCNIILPHKNKI